MKKILMTIAVLCALPAGAQSSRPFDFELSPGCMWTAERAACVVKNQYQAPITCKIDLHAKTFTGPGVKTAKTLAIPPGSFEIIRVFSPPNNVLTHVGGHADCRAV